MLAFYFAGDSTTMQLNDALLTEFRSFRHVVFVSNKRNVEDAQVYNCTRPTCTKW
jgi:hypothetical protein